MKMMSMNWMKKEMPCMESMRITKEVKIIIWPLKLIKALDNQVDQISNLHNSSKSNQVQFSVDYYALCVVSSFQGLMPLQPICMPLMVLEGEVNQQVEKVEEKVEKVVEEEKGEDNINHLVQMENLRTNPMLVISVTNHSRPNNMSKIILKEYINLIWMKKWLPKKIILKVCSWMILE